MKYTLCVTCRCNLDCSYCYITKNPADMSLSLAKKIIDFIYSRTPPDENIQIGFFGGEPLLCFDLLKEIMAYITVHKEYDKNRVEVHLVSNGTIFNGDICDFIKENGLSYCVSCDGPPQIHDRMRKFRDGRGSAGIVKRTLIAAKKNLPHVLVNAVYGPQTFRYLPEVVKYFSSLGYRTISLNPDYSADWSLEDIAMIPQVYQQIEELYLTYHRQNDPHYINLIDSKILIILNGGYRPQDRCRMGSHELAFGPTGNIYPCERLIGSDDGTHAIGSMNSPEQLMLCQACSGVNLNQSAKCLACSLREYCMNWCGCSNFFSTGSYHYTGPFLCASERAAIAVSFDAFQKMNECMGAGIIQTIGRI